VLVDSTVLLNGSALKNVQLTQDRNDNFLISITLTEIGAKQFAMITADHVGKRLGILLAGQLQSAPIVRSTITGGSLDINGNFTKEEATEIVTKVAKCIKP